MGMREGKKKRGKGSLLSEIILWISLERPSVFGLAWRLADDRGRWSWWRVINKHFNRAGKRCRQASGHAPSLGWLAPLQVTKHEQTAARQHCTVCVTEGDRGGKTWEGGVCVAATPEGLMMPTPISIVLHDCTTPSKPVWCSQHTMLKH